VCSRYPSSCLIKESSWVINVPVTKILNTAILQGRHPSRWKMGQVTLLFKKDDETDIHTHIHTYIHKLYLYTVLILTLALTLTLTLSLILIGHYRNVKIQLNCET